MRLASMPEGWWTYTQLGSTALAVVSRRVDGWACYVAGVAGHDHHAEAWAVMRHGDKVKPEVAECICRHLFHPPIDTEGLPYAY